MAALPLYPYQTVTVDALMAGAALVAAMPGSGKTAIAIEYAKRTGAQQVLVTCPAIAVAVWSAEVRKWWPGASAVLLRDLVAGGVRWLRDDRPGEPGQLPAGPTFIVTSFDYLVVNNRARQLLAAIASFDLAIVDESHACKSPTAKRTKLLFGPRCAGDGLLSRAQRTILLTGTPCPNGDPGELWPALRALAPDLIDHMSRDDFGARYRLTRQRPIPGGRTIEQFVGANRATTPELARRLRPFWHRPSREEVERDLPSLRLVLRPLPIEAVDAGLIADLEDSPEAEQLRAAIATGDLRGIEGSVARIRRLLADAKVPAAAAWAEQALDEGELKVLLWGWHVAALEELHRRLARHNPVIITGGTIKRERAVHAFQTDPACRVFVGQIQAAGQAVTLTAARRAVFLEQSFVPGHNFQALKRCHRIGQHRPVLGEVLVIPGSIDQAVAELLVRKADDIAALEAVA